jgi:hypothetical protein
MIESNMHAGNFPYVMSFCDDYNRRKRSCQQTDKELLPDMAIALGRILGAYCVEEKVTPQAVRERVLVLCAFVESECIARINEERINVESN